ncbi:anti-sigma factor domain-containing protein [Paenibacillus humicola]|uniref:anti-sigma factor domain-containing protein n=1 Tax=Paenibacillus humicola TaxID=3110540 RepID=UPI00237A805A|nr:anti-sigma factor domain-containing protein [Paenibacillus humicola]
MNRGIVMEIGKRHLVVLTPDGQFRKVPASKTAVVGEEIRYAEPAAYRRPRTLHSALIGAAAVILLLCVPVFVKQYASGSPVVAYLTMDINPSVELGVGEDDRVMELRAVNGDGAVITKGLPYKGQPVETVASAIMGRVKDSSYFHDGEGDVVITTVVVDKNHSSDFEAKLSEKVDDAVRKSLQKSPKEGEPLHVDVTTLSAPKELRDEANKQGVSAGKMAVYLLAKSNGYNIPLKELETRSIDDATEPLGGLEAVLDEPKKDAAPKQPDTVHAKTSGSDEKFEQQKQRLSELLKQEKQDKPPKPGHPSGKGEGRDGSGPHKSATGQKDDGRGRGGKPSPEDGHGPSNGKSKGDQPNAGDGRKTGWETGLPGVKPPASLWADWRPKNPEPDGLPGMKPPAGIWGGIRPEKPEIDGSPGWTNRNGGGQLGGGGEKTGRDRPDKNGNDSGGSGKSNTNSKGSDLRSSPEKTGADARVGDRSGGHGDVKNVSDGRHTDVKRVNPEKRETPKKTDRPGRPDSQGKQSNPDRPGLPDSQGKHSDRPGGLDSPGKQHGNSDRSGQPDSPGKHSNPDRPGQPDSPGRQHGNPGKQPDLADKQAANL